MIIGRTESLAVEIEPVAPSWSVRYGPEETAWAGLAVWLEGQNVCEHRAPGTDRVRSRVCVPLGPVADWIVRSWPAISYEERPARLPGHGDPRYTYDRWAATDPPRDGTEEEWYEQRWSWWSRHFLDSEAQGSVLPDLGFVRDGESLAIGWAEVCTRSQRRRRSGVAVIPWPEACEVFGQFVGTVSAAFRSSGKTQVFPWLSLDRPLSLANGVVREQLGLYVGRSESELRQMLGLSDGEDLRAHLGLATEDPGSSIVTQILRDLPPSAQGLLQAALEVATMVRQGEPVGDPRRVRQIGADIRREFLRPEEQGHEAAVALRQYLGHDGEPLSDAALSTAARSCGVVVHQGQEETLRAAAVGSLFGSEDRDGRIVSVLRRPVAEQAWVRRFEVGRCLAVAMLDPYRQGCLGRASSPWSSSLSRRRSGAFAAELLLPAAGMRTMGYVALDAAAEPNAFESLLAEYGIGATAAAWQLWNLGLLSSEELRDGLIDRYSAPLDGPTVD